MLAFGYDQNGYFVGLVQRQASPLEPGVWLLPANATDKEPPKCPEGKCLKFSRDNDGWELVEIPQPEKQEESEAQSQ